MRSDDDDFLRPAAAGELHLEIMAGLALDRIGLPLDLVIGIRESPFKAVSRLHQFVVAIKVPLANIASQPLDVFLELISQLLLCRRKWWQRTPETL